MQTSTLFIDPTPQLLTNKQGNEEKLVPRINANLPIDEQKAILENQKDQIEEVSMTDAMWQASHYPSRKKKHKKCHKKHRDIPWDENEAPKPQVPTSEKTAYLQRIRNRTWYPSIGDNELPNTVVWLNTTNIKDHLGRSWVMQPISYVANPGHECFLPQSRIHKFSYHTSSVTNVEMFPTYGHLILSCSLDTTIRIWSLSGDRQCIQIYIGHKQGVSDCRFSRDGFRIASCCYGKALKLWDTEKGFICGAVLDSVPSQLIMNTNEGREEECIVALQDGRAVHYDFRINGEKRPIREYRFHSAPMSAITYLPGSKYFVTSGEDNALVLWEDGIERPVAVLKEPWMKHITALVAHPTEPYVMGQMGGEIVVFRTSPNFNVYSKRSFVGHHPESFACRMTMSPDGSFLASGDARGSLFIWEWKSAQLKKTFELHDQVLIKADWSPYNPSQIITASYDNTMVLLD
ncbi:WD40 repeat-like protein [Histomonas meleagridis]|uniref:WD40 repeat-like protein n=1 Tax=Histomonas meleagridis TaxID=135588 RepID=UPI00355A7646|nr:WD40 repeat-like protein [Histomonas meleagridis]KAH0798793.1 WD40 repeat-like protein [Histomonas meleagridis]